MKRSTDKDMDCGHLRVSRISENQCRKIHEACLEILERVGIRLYSRDAIDLIKKGGARVSEDNIVHIPSQMLEKALETVPKRVVLHDRSGNPAMQVEADCCYYGPGSDCLNIIDHRSGIRRKPVMQDIKEGITLCDALENIDFVMSLLLPTDVNTAIADRYQMEMMLSHTSKPIIFVTYETSGCLDAVKMAEIAVGGEKRLEQKPMIACYINTISGLRHNRDSLEKLLYLSSKKIPSVFIPASTAGMTSPVTPAGAAAMDYSGVLVGIILSQLCREGAPIFVSGMPSTSLDMRTMISPYCDPEGGIMQAMAHYYGLPMFSLAGATESKTVDQQSAAEAALSLTVETHACSHIIHDLGYLESGLTFSFSQLLICDEIVSWLKAYSRKFEINAETLAVDVIAETGHEGGFITTSHTRKHYRDRFYPGLFERESYESWEKNGKKTMARRASEKVDAILSVHNPEPLDSKIKVEIRKIVETTANKV